MRAIFHGLVIVALCLIGGCAETVASGKSYWDIVRDYGDSLTRSEKQDAVTELQEAKQRQKELLEKKNGAAQ